MMLESRNPGSVGLTLEVIQAGDEPLFLTYPSEGMEEIMGKHTQMGVLGSNKYAALKSLPVFGLQFHIRGVAPDAG